MVDVIMCEWGIIRCIKVEILFFMIVCGMVLVGFGVLIVDLFIVGRYFLFLVVWLIDLLIFINWIIVLLMYIKVFLIMNEFIVEFWKSFWNFFLEWLILVKFV